MQFSIKRWGYSAVASIFVLSFCLHTVSVFAVASTNEGISEEEKSAFRAQNDVLYFNDEACSGGGGSTQLTGDDNVTKAMNYLMSHGFTLAQAAGAVGNMQWESGSENLDPKGSDGTAFGIVQWQGDRLANLKTFGGSSYDTVDTQIKFIGEEFGWEPSQNGSRSGTEKGALGPIMQTTTPEEAALAWEHTYERSADAPGSVGLTTRQSNARKLYDKYNNGNVQALSSTTGGSSSNSGGSCSSSSASGPVNSDGYAFPIALSQTEVSNGYSWPCPGDCHHDGTPAFDLSKKAQDDSTEGTPVIAIYKGTIQRFNNAYSGINGCQSFQLVGDDGWWYWYGHLQSASIQDGATVNAGQQIAAVGRRACTGNGSYPHLHIDRGSPQGHYGGDVCCRDEGFTSLINKLYDELGGGTPSAL